MAFPRPDHNDRVLKTGVYGSDVMSWSWSWRKSLCKFRHAITTNYS